MARKRKSPSRVRRAITAAIPWAVFAALIGIPILLDVWQLSVYPAVIGGLVLFWMYLEHRAKTDPDHPLGFLDHKHAMQFGFLFGIPAVLFLAVWTFGLTFSGHPVLKKAGLIILALVIITVVCAEPIGKLGDGLFAARQARQRKRSRNEKQAQVIKKSRSNPLKYLISPYLKFEANVTTGVCKGGESEGQRTQFSETVFHFRSLILNLVVLAIRTYWDDPTSWVTYLQLVWIITSLVGWNVYLSRSASAIPIIEPGQTLAVFIFGFGGGLLVASLVAPLVHQAVSMAWTREGAIEAVFGLAVVSCPFLAWFLSNWIYRKFNWRNQFFIWMVLALWVAFAWIVHLAIRPMLDWI